MQQEQKHEERRVRTEQKTTEKKARNEANAAEKERRRAEKGGTEQRKSRFLPAVTLPTFLGRGAVAGGAAAGAGTAAVAEGAVDAAEGGARAVTGGAAAPGAAAAAAEPGEPTEAEPVGETVHDQVTVDPGEAGHDDLTMDPGEAAHAVAAADAEEAPKPAAVPLPQDEDVGSPDNIGAGPYSSTTHPQEVVTPASPTSPTSPTKRNSRVKSFFKRFRAGSKAENDYVPEQTTDREAEPKEDPTDVVPAAEPTKEEDAAATDSIRDVALAGRSDNETEDMYGGSAKPGRRVSPLRDEEAAGAGPAASAGGAAERGISPASDTSSLSEEPYVIAADVASSRYSTEHTGSKRNSGYEQVANLTDEDDEPRGRKGFRERFLKKVIPGRDKDKRQPGAFTSSAVGNSGAAATTAEASNSAPVAHAANTDSAPVPDAEPDSTNAAPAGHIDDTPHEDDHAHDHELPRQKVQEPSTTSTEATGNTTVTGTTTPALTHAQTNGDDDEDFEEARDTFDEGRLISASKVDSGAARIVDVTTPMTPTGGGPRGRTSGEGSRFTEEL